jgi:DNA repair protein RecN (Recombination protein N)
MLRSLLIRDFVIVERLELGFERGFTALTGETGAGKSILIDALGLVLGDRADASLVRAGAGRAEIDAGFELAPDSPVREWLRAQALDDEADPALCMLRRVIDAGGRARAWVNGRPATLGQLRELGEQLVDVHGQHEHQSLARGAAQRALLDGYGGLERDAAALARAHAAWQRAREARESAELGAERSRAEREQLAWQVAELRRLAPRAGEWAELSAEHTRLAHAARLIEAAQTAIDSISEGEDTLLARLAALNARLEPLTGVDPQLNESVALLTAGAVELREAAQGLRRYRDRLEVDPGRLRELDERIAALHGAARRFRCAPEALPERLAELEAQLDAAQAGADPRALAEREHELRSAYEGLARGLSAARAGAAQALAREVSAAMQRLAMEGGRFEVALVPLAAGGSGGLEQVEFRVAPHPGTAAMPVASTASGGELSRIALAIQAAASRVARVPTLIFDEVDAGIGGRVAEVVGRMLGRLGEHHQVLCVTHLPQVAVAAHHQFRVSKRSGARGVRSAVVAVEGDERVAEIARMLGGLRVTDTTRKAAAEMLAAARDRAPLSSPS